MIPEFVGRLPIVVSLNELDETALKRILTEPKNSLIKQYKKMFEIDGVDIEFTDGALSAFARKAIELNTGARGLRNIMEDVMLPLMYNTPSSENVSKIVVDCDEKGNIVTNVEENKINETKSA